MSALDDADPAALRMVHRLSSVLADYPEILGPELTYRLADLRKRIEDVAGEVPPPQTGDTGIYRLTSGSNWDDPGSQT